MKVVQFNPGFWGPLTRTGYLFPCKDRKAALIIHYSNFQNSNELKTSKSMFRHQASMDAIPLMQ
jgi:hypothetical protein